MAPSTTATASTPQLPRSARSPASPAAAGRGRRGRRRGLPAPWSRRALRAAGAARAALRPWAAAAAAARAASSSGSASGSSLGPWGAPAASFPPQQQPQWLFDRAFSERSLDALQQSASELCLRSWLAATGVVVPSLPPSSPPPPFSPSAAALSACRDFAAGIRADPAVATRPAAVCSRLPLPDPAAAGGGGGEGRVCPAGCASGLGLGLCSSPPPSPALSLPLATTMATTPTPTPTPTPAPSSSSLPEQRKPCLSDGDCPPASDPSADTCDAAGLDPSLLGSLLALPPLAPLPASLCTPLAACDAATGATIVRCAGGCRDFCSTAAAAQAAAAATSAGVLCSGPGDPVCGPAGGGGTCVTLPEGACRNATGGCDSALRKISSSPCFGRCSLAGVPRFLRATLSADYSVLILELDREARLTAGASVAALFGSAEAAVAAGVVAAAEGAGDAAALSLAGEVDFSSSPPTVARTLRISLLASASVRHGDAISVGPQQTASGPSGPAVVDALTGEAFAAADGAPLVVGGAPAPPRPAASGPRSLGRGCPSGAASSSSSQEGASWSALPSRVGIRLPSSIEWRAEAAAGAAEPAPELVAAAAAANAAGTSFAARAALSLSADAVASLAPGEHTLVLRATGPGEETREARVELRKASVPLPRLLLFGAEEAGGDAPSAPFVRFVASRGPLRLRPMLEPTCPGSPVTYSWGYRSVGGGASSAGARLAPGLIEASPGGGKTRELTLGALSSASSSAVVAGPVPGAVPGSTYSFRLLARFEEVLLSGGSAVDPRTGEDASVAVLDVDAIATAAPLSVALAGPAGDVPVVASASDAASGNVPSLMFVAAAVDPDDALAPVAQRPPLVFDWSCSVLAPMAAPTATATPTPPPTPTPARRRRLVRRQMLSSSPEDDEEEGKERRRKRRALLAGGAGNDSPSPSSTSRALVPFPLSVSAASSLSSSYVSYPCNLDPTGVLDDGAGRLTLLPWALGLPKSLVEPQSSPPLLVEVGVSARRGLMTATASPSLTLVPYDASGGLLKPLGSVKRWCSGAAASSGGGCIGAEFPPTEPLRLSYEAADAATLAADRARGLSYRWSCQGEGCPAALLPSAAGPAMASASVAGAGGGNATSSSTSSSAGSAAASALAASTSSAASSAVSGASGRVLVVYPYDAAGNPTFRDGSVLTLSVMVTRLSSPSSSPSSAPAPVPLSSTASTVVRVARRPTCAASPPAACLVVTPASGAALATSFTLSTGPWIAAAEGSSPSSGAPQPPLSFEFGVVRAADGARQPRIRGWPSASFDLGPLPPSPSPPASAGGAGADGYTTVYACASDAGSGAEACATARVAVAAVPVGFFADGAAAAASLSARLAAAAASNDPAELVAAVRAIVVSSPVMGGNGAGGAALVAAKQGAVLSLARALVGSGGIGGGSSASAQPLPLSPGDALAVVSLLKELTSPVGAGGGTVRKVSTSPSFFFLASFLLSFESSATPPLLSTPPPPAPPRDRFPPIKQTRPTGDPADAGDLPGRDAGGDRRPGGPRRRRPGGGGRRGLPLGPRRFARRGLQRAAGAREAGVERGDGPAGGSSGRGGGRGARGEFFCFYFSFFPPGGSGFERGKRKLENRTRSSLLPVLSSPTAHPNDQNRTSSEPSSPPPAAAWPRESRPSSSSPTFSSRWPP